MHGVRACRSHPEVSAPPDCRVAPSSSAALTTTRCKASTTYDAHSTAPDQDCTQTHRHTQTQTHRHTDTNTDTDPQTQTQNTNREREREREIERERERERERQRERSALSGAPTQSKNH